MDWRRVLETVALAGPGGISHEALFERLQGEFPGQAFDGVTRPIVLERLRAMPEIERLSVRAAGGGAR